MKTQILSSSQIEEAALLLKKGEVVAFPTETVYGLGARLFDEQGINRIFAIKGRPKDNPLIIHISHLNDVALVAREIPDDFYKLSLVFFPGPLTIILRRNPHISLSVTGGLDSVAFRMPSCPIAHRLIELVGEPLVAPSANLSGKPSSTHWKHVLEDFQDKISAVIDGGECTFGIESTVMSLLNPQTPLILRPGTVEKEALERVLNKPVKSYQALGSQEEEMGSPGMKYRHYAPKAPIYLFTSWKELENHIDEFMDIRRLILTNDIPQKQLKGAIYSRLSKKNLYATLRLSDLNRYDEILIFCDEEMLTDLALMNRLNKASS